MGARKKFSCKHDELDDLVNRRAELDAKIRSVRAEAKEEESEWENEAEKTLGRLVLDAIGAKWTKIEFARVVSELAKADLPACEAQNDKSPYFAIRKLREAVSCSEEGLLVQDDLASSPEV